MGCGEGQVAHGCPETADLQRLTLSAGGNKAETALARKPRPLAGRGVIGLDRKHRRENSSIANRGLLRSSGSVYTTFASACWYREHLVSLHISSGLASMPCLVLSPLFFCNCPKYGEHLQPPVTEISGVALTNML